MSGQKHKISVIGAGQVGGTAAHLLLQKELGDVVLFDIAEGVPQGKALDLGQSGAVEGYNTKIVGTNDYKDTLDSDIVFITAGFPRKPGMDRLDLLKKNAGIIEDITENTKKYSPESIVIVMTNPVDVLSYHAWKLSGFPKNRVMGQAGVLDTARFKYFISRETEKSMREVGALVLGGHGDTMVPVIGRTVIKGAGLADVISSDKMNLLIEKTRQGGAEIVSLLKTGSAYYAPAASGVAMIEAILKDKKTVMPLSCYLDGQYGINDVFIGVPAVLGRNGVEKIEEITLTEEELTALQKSAKVYKESIAELTNV